MHERTTTTTKRTRKNDQGNNRSMRDIQVDWNGKTYAIKNVSGFVKLHENGQDIYYFSATDGQGTFELKFTSAEMEWFLG